MNRFKLVDELTKIINSINSVVQTQEWERQFDTLVKYEEFLLELGDDLNSLKEKL